MGYAVTQLTRLCDRLIVPHAGTPLSWSLQRDLLDQVIVQDAAVHDCAAQLRIATVTDRLPDRVAGALEVLIDFGVDLVAGDGLGAAEFTHHHFVAAVRPPIQGVFNGIHDNKILT